MEQAVKLMKIISNQVDSKMQIVLEKYSLTYTQVKILHYIMNNDCLNQKQICETFKLSSATVNGILNRLESKNYISREKTNDRRNNKITATDKARQVNESFQKAVEYNNKILSKGLNQEDVIILTKLLEQILQNIEEGIYD